MTPLPLPSSGEIRRRALHRYGLHECVPDPALDDLAGMAATICGVRMAMILLMDESRQWSQSGVGFVNHGLSSAFAFHQQVVLSPEPLVVPDTSRDARFKMPLLGVDGPEIRFYAGAPLITPAGEVMGTLCVLDEMPHTLTPVQARTLQVLAQQVMTHLELKRQTLELAEQERLLRTVTENAKVGLVMVDRAHRYLYANEAYARMFSLETPAIVGQRVADVLPDLYTQQIAPRLKLAFAGERVAYDLKQSRPSGDLYYAVRYDPTWVGKEVGFVLVVITDITPRKETEMANGRLADIVQFSDDSIIGKDLDGIITTWNHGAEKVFGYRAEEMIGHSILELIPEERHQEEDFILGSIRAGRSVEHFETQRLNKDGCLLDVSVTASPIRDADGRVIGVSKVTRNITERKRADAEREKLMMLIECSPDFIAIADLSGKITFLNTGGRRMIGLGPEDDEGQLKFTDYLAPEYHDFLLGTVLPIVREESVWNGEMRLIHLKTGERIDVLRTIFLLRDHQGEPQFFATVTQDITRRKKAETALKENEARLRSLVSMMPDAMFIRQENQVVYINQRGLKLWRADGESRILGRSPLELIHPDSRAEVEARQSLVMKEEEVSPVSEIRILALDGTVVEVETTSAAFPYGGKPAVQVIVRDISERKRTEAAVRESESYFRFLDSLTENIRPLLDARQIMAAMCGMLGRHLGTSRCAYAEVDPVSGLFTVLEEYTDGCEGALGSYPPSNFGSRVGNTLGQGQTLVLRNVDQELPLDEGGAAFGAIGIRAIICCPLIRDGGLSAVMAVHQTEPRDWKPAEIRIVQTVVERCWAALERMAAAEEIQQLNASLEQRVNERTAQLEAANKELEAFSYTVSHDLRAPLRAIDGFSQAVLEDFGPLMPEEGLRYLNTIRGGAQRMGLLIDDLLTFSRLSRAPLEKVEINTMELVKGVLSDLKSSQAGREIDLRLGDLPSCQGAPALVKQVWINLLSNAFKYTRKRTKAVVEIGSFARPGGTIYFVRDNGTGFDMRYADKLFGVFQRLHRAEDYEGTGVGLAIVQRVIHRHGGGVRAEAAPDAGATFYFNLEGQITL